MIDQNTGKTPFPPKKKKSIKLAKEERSALRVFLKGYDTRVEAAEVIGLSPTVLYNVELKGCGAPETIEKIREAINVPA